MPHTFAEKILSAKTGQRLRQGDFIVAPVNGAFASDTTAPFAIQAFREMGGRKLWDPTRFALVIDHASPAPNERVARLHQMMREFANETGCILHDVGRGIAHHVLMDDGFVQSGDLFVGADSHTCSHGVLGAFATGIGSTDLAGVMFTGCLWLKVPGTIKIVFHGQPPVGLTGKDVALYLVAQLGISGADYAMLEIHGLENQSLSFCYPIANMAIETGAKAAVVLGRHIRPEFYPSCNASYQRELEIDLSRLTPAVALPGSPGHVEKVRSLKGQKIDVAFIGSCTQNRIEDIREVAQILKGRKVAKHVRLYVSCATRELAMAAMREGLMADILDAGGTLLPSGCGPCVGTHLGVPGDGEVVLSSANRNFKGRMGNPHAEVYLASVQTVARSALNGHIEV